jgi:hypothetical protein
MSRFFITVTAMKADSSLVKTIVPTKDITMVGEDPNDRNRSVIGLRKFAEDQPTLISCAQSVTQIGKLLHSFNGEKMRVGKPMNGGMVNNG